MEPALRKSKIISTNMLVKVAILAAISYILAFISTPLPIFPSFLKIDISDVVSIIGGLSLGPVGGFLIVLIKNSLQMLNTTTAGIGEFANILIAGSYVIVISTLYKNKKELKSVIIGAIVGVILMTIIGCITNYYMLLPFYATVMPMEAIIDAGSIINPKVVDLKTFVIYMIAPFNILKGTILSIIMLPTYKKLYKVINR